jgi:hypothetical protein
MRIRPFAKTLALAFIPFAALACAATGCAAQTGDEEASATTTSALQAQSESGLTDGVLDIDGTLAPDPAVAAQAVAEKPTKGLYPAGCATKTLSGDVVTITLDACTGPFGKVVMNGTLTATFSKTADDTLHVDVASGSDLVANDRPVKYEGHADVTWDGTTRHLVYQGASSGTTKRGKDFSRQTNLTVDADVSTHCATMDGTSKGSVGKYEIDLSIQGFQGCTGSCPSAGAAHASINGPLVNDASLDVSFDGSSKAHVKVKTKNERDFDVSMDCDAAEAAE